VVLVHADASTALRAVLKDFFFKSMILFLLPLLNTTARLCFYISKIKQIGLVDARIEVFTAVTKKNGVFWDVTPCGSYKNRRFGGTWGLLHQDDKNR
jgi:hypothetical protein